MASYPTGPLLSKKESAGEDLSRIIMTFFLMDKTDRTYAAGLGTIFAADHAATLVDFCKLS